MEISDLFIGSLGRLKEVRFKNDLSFENAEDLQLNFEDSFSQHELSDKGLKVLYTRKVSNISGELEIVVTFEIFAQLKEDTTTTLEEAIQTIDSDKSRFVAFAPFEMSLLIANIMKTGGFPPVITQPSFIEKDE